MDHRQLERRAVPEGPAGETILRADRPGAPPKILAYRMGFAVAATALAERIGLVAYLNSHLDWDAKQCKVSPGIRLLALIIAIMVEPRALYRLEEFYHDQDCAVLFGAERHAADFNDDAIGRALLKLFESQSGQIYSGICRQAVDRLALPASDTAHVDTTSVTLEGAYAHPDAGARPVRGYNKDGHPESVQLVTGLVTRNDGVPWGVDVMDGNTSDATWTAMVLQQAGLTLPDELRAQVLFVADSKMVSEATVADCCAADISFVSRLPNTFGLERQTKEAVREAGQWDADRPVQGDTGTVYRVCETRGVIGDAAVRLVVVHSSALAAKAEHWEKTQTAREAASLDRQIASWDPQRFACADDAEHAWQTWQATKAVAQGLWAVEGAILEEDTPEGPQWRVQATRAETPRADRIAAERFRRSTFILVSNDPRRSARDLLTAYKRQYVNEQDHAMVKGPLQIVPLYLKDTKKITAYVYCVYLALLLWRSMQAVMRQNQARLGFTLPYPNGALQPAPTTKRLKEILHPIQVIQWHEPTGEIHRYRSDLSLVQRQALLLLGMNSGRFTQIPSG